jgi:hypothetical protein
VYLNMWLNFSYWWVGSEDVHINCMYKCGIWWKCTKIVHLFVRADCIFHRVCGLEFISLLLERQKEHHTWLRKITKGKQIVVLNILSFKLHFNYICNKLLLQLILWNICNFSFCHKFFRKCFSIERNKSVRTINFCTLNMHCLRAKQFLLYLKNLNFKIYMKYIAYVIWNK